MALSSISKINRKFAVNIGWNQDKAELYYELLAFYPNLDYRIKMYLIGESNYSVLDKTIFASVLGNTEEFTPDNISAGNYTVSFEIYDLDDEIILTAQKEISILSTGIDDFLSESNINKSISIRSLGNRMVNVTLPESDNYELQIFNLSGQHTSNKHFWGSSIDLTFPSNGLYIINIRGEKTVFSKKVLIN